MSNTNYKKKPSRNEINEKIIQDLIAVSKEILFITFLPRSELEYFQGV